MNLTVKPQGTLPTHLWAMRFCETCGRLSYATQVFPHCQLREFVCIHLHRQFEAYVPEQPEVRSA